MVNFWLDLLSNNNKPSLKSLLEESKNTINFKI